MLTIGFTGTRHGMTDAQKDQVDKYMDQWIQKTDDLVMVRHGCCEGADEDFTVICNYIGFPPVGIVAHPPIIQEWLSNRAMLLSHYRKRPRNYLLRNRNIVYASDRILATPREYESEQKGSGGGTWYTIRYARSLNNKPLYIILPDGKVRTDG
jgi:hypothetical protein